MEPSAGIGSRLRALRRSAGMTQDELAAGRFTKQYVSQIERGEVVPSSELLDWLADRLGVERMLLETGIGAAELERIEAGLREGWRTFEQHLFDAAAERFRLLRESLVPEAPQHLVHRALCGEAWSNVRRGELTAAAERLEQARAAAESAGGTTAEQAEVAYVSAVRAYMASEIETSHLDFARALRLLDEADEPDDSLRSDIHQWRSRCYRRERDWEAAREDVDRALELCESLDDDRRRAEVNLQASLVAERQGHWLLARRQAEASRELFDAVGDTLSAGRALNNVAGLNHLLGNDDVAVAQLKEAFEIFLAANLDVEAGYVLSSLAEIHREQGDLDEAESVAQRALGLLKGRIDHIQEVGTAQLVLARTLLEQGELGEAEDMLAAVDASYGVTESVSHQARSWMTRGELELLRENEREAARLYRRAATALQPDDL